MSINAQPALKAQRSFARAALMVTSVLAAGSLFAVGQAHAAGVCDGSTNTVYIPTPVISGPDQNVVLCNVQSNGDLFITDGGSFSVNRMVFGDPSGGGNLVVDGAGSVFNVEDFFSMYGSGKKNITVTNGGIINVNKNYINFGSSDDDLAKIVISGTGSALNMLNQTINLGVRGQGMLLISNGGHLNASNGSAYMASNGNANIMVAGAGSRWDQYSIDLARNGNSTLYIVDGGVVDTSNGYFSAGSDVTGVSVINVDGSGSQLLSKIMFMGAVGNSVINITNDALVKVSAGGYLRLGGYEGNPVAIVNIGAEKDAVAVRAGRLEVDQIYFGTGSEINFNHLDVVNLDAYLTSIGGDNGVINQIAGRTNYSGYAGNYYGTTNVMGGELYVNGALAGGVNVSGGLLGGKGHLQNLTMLSGGTYRASIHDGSLTLAGDVVFKPGSVFEVEVDPATGQSGKLTVWGATTIEGGLVKHTGLSGKYRPRRHFEIVTAHGGLTGQFDGIETQFAFLDASLTYTDKSVVMTLQRNDIDFADIGQTRNERSVGANLQTLDWANPLFEAVVELDVADARSAFGQMAGELHGSLRTAALGDSAVLRRAVLGANTTGMAEGKSNSVWVSPIGAFGDYDSTDNNTALEARTTGALMGADKVFGGQWQLGVLAGFDKSDIKAQAAGSATRDSYHLGVHGMTQRGALGLRGGVVGSWHDFDTRRSIVFTGFNEQLRSEYSGTTIQVFAEADWTVAVGETTVKPFVSVAHVSMDTDAHTDQGGHAALDIADASQAVVLSTVGVGAQRAFALKEGRQIKLTGRMGWEMASGDLDSVQRQAFAGGSDFAVEGLGYDDNAFVAEIGMQMPLRRAGAISLDWQGLSGDSRSQHNVAATYRLSF